MKYEVNFGTLSTRKPTGAPGKKFRLALLGDFSGRANAGRLEIGDDLAHRRPLRVDVDTLDDVMARLDIALDLALDGEAAGISVPIGGMDAFHPDELAGNLALFAELRGLRKSLGNKAGFDRAAKQVLSWSGAAPLPRAPRRAAGAAVATDRKLSDFARLTGRPAAADRAEQSVEALMRRLIGPLVQPAKDARADALIARVDEALSLSMRRILHHPDFQTAEALWRGVEFLVRRIETGAAMEIVLYDVSAEELAADIAAGDALESSGLYGMLVEQPALDAHQGPLSAVIGLYQFELSPVHADLLGRIATVAAAAGVPFIAGIAPDRLTVPMREQNELTSDAWAALRALPQAAWLGLVAPRFLLRLPYGRKTDPIDAFAFEEFTRQSGLSGMLWGHPALIPALLLAESFARQGARMQLGSVLGVRDMAYYVYTDADGDQVALPCTERLYTERQAVAVAQYGAMPVLSLRGRPEVRLGGLTSVAGAPLAGFWAPPGATPEPEAPPDRTEDAPEPAPQAEAPSEESDTDLDALLAGLSADPPEPAEEETDVDLDALLASLK
jgi:type VI secretion system protein ImpC